MPVERGTHAAAVALIVVTLLAAGCLGGSGAPPTPVSKASDNATRTTELPDGFGSGSGLQETTARENGTGGVAHSHDYWAGRELVTLFQGDVDLNYQAPVPLANGSLVFEGTDKVTVLVGAISMVVPPILYGGSIPRQSVPAPQPPAIKLQFRTAAETDWRAPMPISQGQPIVIPVLPREVDMPHSTRSLWSFQLKADATQDEWTTWVVNLTITIHKGRSVSTWPGHPDFYANGPVRQIAESKKGTYTDFTIQDFVNRVPPPNNTWISPDKLVSWGTDRLLVWLNVTKFEASAQSASLDNVSLSFYNATYHDYAGYGGASKVDSTNRSWFYNLTVDPQGMDGPYQPSSRWTFQANPAVYDQITDPGWLTSGYKIEYTLTILAVNDTKLQAAMGAS